MSEPDINAIFKRHLKSRRHKEVIKFLKRLEQFRRQSRRTKLVVHCAR